MNASDWLDLTVLERKKYNYLSEVLDLTGQMGAALDRNDQVSLRMLISMRQEPLLCLEDLRRTIQVRRQELPPEDQERVTALLSGASPRNDGESTFSQQAATVSRLLTRVVELDRIINMRLTGGASVYRGGQP